jgi:DNA-binding transcriptional LysR family regulator
MDLDLRLLAGFVGVAEELNFSRAAARLHVTQPALTRQIRQLETLVGAALFERTTRQVSLTPAGQALLEPARRTLASAEEAVQAARRAAHGARGRLRVGLSQTAGFEGAPIVVRRFGERHPDVQLEVTRSTTAGSVTKLRRREIDIAFVRTPLEGADELDHVVILDEPTVIALPEHHGLAAHERVPRELLSGEPFVLFSRELSPGVYDLITGYLWPGDPDPEAQVTERRADEDAMVEAVASGHGLTITRASRARHLRIPGVVYRPLTPPFQLELALAWRVDDPNPLVPAFARLAAEVAAESSVQAGH